MYPLLIEKTKIDMQTVPTPQLIESDMIRMMAKALDFPQTAQVRRARIAIGCSFALRRYFRKGAYPEQNPGQGLTTLLDMFHQL